MPKDLIRYQHSGDLHFVTFSCYHRQPFLGTSGARDLFEHSLETMRIRYGFYVSGYVVMPEHVHILISEPESAVLARALQALKLSVAVQRTERPFWQARYYDFNVHTERKRTEKLRYMHHNPVTRGLAAEPDQWPWSSFHHILTGDRGVVEIESQWTAARREPAVVESQISKRDGANTPYCVTHS